MVLDLAQVVVQIAGVCYKSKVKLCYRVMRKNENVTRNVTLENGLTMRVEGVL